MIVPKGDLCKNGRVRRGLPADYGDGAEKYRGWHAEVQGTQGNKILVLEGCPQTCLSADRFRRWRRKIQGWHAEVQWTQGNKILVLEGCPQMTEMAQRNKGVARRGAGDAEAQGGQRNTVLVLWWWRGLFLGTEEPG
jgi:hypothetical protein